MALRRSASAAGLLDEVAGCDAILLDVFALAFESAAARFNVPAVIVSQAGIWTPPPFPLLPLPLASLVRRAPLPSSYPAATAVWLIEAVVSPLVLTTMSAWRSLVVLSEILMCRTRSMRAVHLTGTVYYGTPRHLLASFVSRPVLAPSGHAMLSVPANRATLLLGPYAPESAGAPSAAAYAASGGDEGFVADLSPALPQSCGASRPLIVAPGRLIFAAFGTLVRLPKALLSDLCGAAAALVDAGEADAALIARRPLGFNDSAGVGAACLASVPAQWRVETSPQRPRADHFLLPL